MQGRFKKIVSIITIVFLLTFQVVNVRAFEAPSAPTPPREPESSISAPIVPETPALPSVPAIELVADPISTEAPITSQGGQGGDNEDTQSDNQEIQNTPVSNPDPDTLQSGSSGQSSPGNTGDTTIKTGDGATSGSLTNIANTNTVSQNPSTTSGSPEVNLANSGNGSGSKNSTSLDNESNTSTIQDNTATVNNDLNLDTITGNSSASSNIGNSEIATGDANTSGTLVNTVNSNLAGLMVSEFNVVDDQMGDLILDWSANCILGCSPVGDLVAQNTGNGSGSENSNNITQIIDNNTFQNNDAVVENTLTLTADSGNNQADKNTGGDSAIKTGDANVAGSVLNFLNSNVAGQVLVGVVNIFGDLIGDIILPDIAGCTNCNGDVAANNSGNGAGSNNASDIAQTTNNTTAQTNIADIQNNLNFSANTGENIASRNTGGSSTIETGEADINAQALNIANSNISGGDWWLVIVNQAGEWIGQILGAPGGTSFAGSSGSDFTVGPDGTISAQNSGNGAGSQNTNNIGQTTNSNVTQNNDAQIINNLNFSANTGSNSTSKNTGGNNLISTGDATVIANLINLVNTNIGPSGRLMVVTINIFGKWIGDFMSQGQKKDNGRDNQTANGEANQNSTPVPQGGPDVENIQPIQPQGSPLNTTGHNNNDNNADSKDNGPALENTINNTPPPSINLPQTLTSASNSGSGEVQASSVNAKDKKLPNQVLGIKTQQAENLKKVVDINLAWLIIMLPFLGLSIKLAHKLGFLKIFGKKI